MNDHTTPSPGHDVPEDVRETLAQHRERQAQRERAYAPRRERAYDDPGQSTHGETAGRRDSHESTEAIRHDIEETRARMDQTIDTLQLRLTPQYMAQQTMDKIKYHSSRTGNRFTNLVRENPVPAIISGLGLTWLIGAGMRSGHEGHGPGYHPASAYDAEMRARQSLYEAGMESQGSAYPPPGQQHAYGSAPAHGGSEGLRERAGEMGERARDYGHQAKEKASEYGEQAREKASEMGHRISDTASHMRHQASEAGHRISDTTRRATHQATETASDLFEQHPLSVGLGVMAAGLALGLLLPSTRKEDEVFGEQRDKLLHQAQEYGSDLAERGQAVAQRATEAAKEAAHEQGITGEDVKEEGQDFVRRANEVASETTQAARDEAKKQGLAGGESESQRRPGGSESQT